MITIPVEVGDHLPYVISAARRADYLGLMVVLARTAEARGLHQELTRDWTSIHDVTGHALGVLCPEPRFVPPPARFPQDPGRVPRERRDAFVAEASRAHRFLSGADPAGIPPFDYTRLLVPGAGDGDDLRAAAIPLPGHPPALHHAAWTEAVSRCARFFGIPESRLPALLVLCLREEDDVLIQLRGDTSLYRLCKMIASHPGYSREDGDLMAERERLRWGAPAGYGGRETPPRRMRGLAGRTRKQLDGLRRHLAMIAPADPELAGEVADGLARHVEADTPVDEARDWLSALAERVAGHPRKTELLRLDAKLRKVARALEEAAYPGGRRRWEDQDRLAELERRLASRPGLARACEDAARAVLGECVTERLSGGPHPSRVRAVRPLGPAPRPPAEDTEDTTTNSLSGTSVHGPAIQARDIGALHLHLHAGAWPPGAAKDLGDDAAPGR
ncbi:hypothetical protein [Bailinhaonella thermotolerans]|nr:hypothetical protein [Bailinhaonella thermotolerans]